MSIIKEVVKNFFSCRNDNIHITSSVQIALERLVGSVLSFQKGNSWGNEGPPSIVQNSI